MSLTRIGVFFAILSPLVYASQVVIDHFASTPWNVPLLVGELLALTPIAFALEWWYTSPIRRAADEAAEQQYERELAAIYITTAQKRYRSYVAMIESDPTYHAWEAAALRKLYPTHTFTICGSNHVAICIPGPSRFTSVCKPDLAMVYEDLVTPAFTAATPLSEIFSPEDLSDSAKRYLEFQITSGGVRFPERAGFEPKVWHLDADSGPLVTVGAVRFGDMIATMYELQLELYQCYKKGVQPTESTVPLRYAFGLIGNAFVSVLPAARPGYHPILGVQALTVLYDRTTPKFVTFTRVGSNISTRPGWKQFPPAGAMETFGKPNSGEGFVNAAVDPGDSLLREFIEEIFGVKEFEEPDLSAHRNLRRHREALVVLDALKNGDATIRFLGIVADPVSFRAELSFLIVVKDLGWQLKAGNESVAAPEPLTLSGLSAWLRDGSGPLNPSSAGLLRLAIESGALADEGIADQATLNTMFLERPI